MTWDSDTLKSYMDRVESGLEHRLAHQLQFTEDMQRRWSERFNGAEHALGNRIAELTRELNALRKIVYTGLGLAIAIAFVLPLILQRIK